MGQYYKAYVRFDDSEGVYNPHNAVFMAKHNIEHPDKVEHTWDYDDPMSYGYNNSGYKLLEHSWMKNRFVNGVLERIRDNPARIAWVGDYSDEEAENGDVDGFDKDTYLKVWGKDGMPDLPFPAAPEIHLNGYLVNHDRGEYVSIASFEKLNGINDKDGRHWCLHPLPLLTAIGNGKGGGDYATWDKLKGQENVGIWAMDLLEYMDERPAFMEEAVFEFDSNA